jgi:hypothetical protein
MPNANKHALAVIKAIGGVAEFARWYDISRSLCSHWRQGFPAHSYFELSHRLKAEHDIEADPRAWKMARRAKKRRPAPRAKRPQPKASASASA